MSDSTDGRPPEDALAELFPWDSLQYFLELVRKGTLARAARRLGVSHTTVLRRIAVLEKQLDAKLFERDSRGYSLTSAGRELLQHAEQMEQTAEEIFRVPRIADGLAGPVRVAAIEGLATRILAPAFVRFAERHPGIRIEVISMMQPANVNLREADISVGPSAVTGPSLISEKVATCPIHLYASREYLARHGIPLTINDLDEHLFVDYVDDLVEMPELAWLRDTIGVRTVVFRSTSPIVQLESVRRSIGIGMFPDYMITDEPDLVAVLPDRVEAQRAYWLAMRRELWAVPRMEATARFLGSTLRSKLGRPAK